jgi:hypothetical protein
MFQVPLAASVLCLVWMALMYPARGKKETTS